MLRDYDGFDLYGNITNVGRYWTVHTASSYPALSASGGRRSTAGIQLSYASGIARAYSAQAKRTVGFSLALTNFPASTQTILAYYDGGTVQMSVAMTSTGVMQVYRGEWLTGGGSGLLATASLGLLAGQEYYIEFSATISDAAGAFELRVNNETVASGTSVDTKASSNATSSVVRIGNGSLSTVFGIVDDYYCTDGSGSEDVGFLGECRVDEAVPTGDGANTAFTTSTGTDHYALVDESTPDDDTSYVQDTAGKDTFTFPALAFTPDEILAVGIRWCAKKNDAGARTLAPVVRPDVTDDVGDAQALSTSYAWYLGWHRENPDTVAAWEVAEVDATEVGLEAA